ncbi:endonuclease/exonuclease/phosphatase family protein [Bythopirellula polymerisocia]|uniref:Endonuclease/Exonuclease/phosphatase family protein n=1 Tax=Bythopirellula polymerisocia TaxID=2528003 RepID=A0A5C6CB45_9BACT|nr:endonuclease/exonuclease/phosphatase family protein [Bythopirellula polymerisocia]TWU21840.1 Endonuclease/Exonuclease/phosphatase family protein [Bythopirellula polymerisocia]
MIVRHEREQRAIHFILSQILLAMIGTICNCGFAAPSVAAESPDASTVRVMSFNIRNGKAQDGANHWRNRRELVIKTIRQFDPDVLGTQELMGMQAEFFKQNLSEYEHHGTSRIPTDPEEEQSAIYFLKSRFKKTQSGHFWLSETPDVPGSKSWNPNWPRMVSWTHLRERSRPESSFFVFNTHFDNKSREARLQSAAILRAHIEFIAGASPAIITGDFNSDEGSLPYQVLLYSTDALSLTDTYRLNFPFHAPKGESSNSHWTGSRSGRRIDWILSTPHWDVSEAAIDYFNDQGRYPSDHYPVTAVLELKN